MEPLESLLNLFPVEHFRVAVLHFWIGLAHHTFYFWECKEYNYYQIMLSNKENYPLSPSRELQKLKVELNDRNFELRKIEEDYADQKGRLLMEATRERNSHLKLIKELKEKIAFENQAWAAKIDQMRELKNQEIREIERNFQDQLSREKTILEQAVREQCKNNILRGEEEKDELIKAFAEQKAVIAQQHTAELLSMKKEWEKMEHEMRVSHSVASQKLIGQSEKAVNNANNSLANEIRLHLKAKDEISSLQILLVKQRIQFEGVIKELKCEVSLISDDLRRSEYSAKLAQDQYLAQTEQLKYQNSCKQRHWDEEREAIGKLHEKKQRDLREKYRVQVSETQEKMVELQRKYEQKEKLWQQRGQTILAVYEKRESKREDIKTIENLEVELIRKQFQLEREQTQLKHCKLELENMEEVYDKIFVASTYFNQARSRSFKLKKLKLPGLTYAHNRSAIEHKKPM